MTEGVLGYTPNFGFKLINFNFVPWHELDYDNWRTLDTVLRQFMSINALRGVWINSTAYAVGDRAVDAVDGLLYECEIAHTSAAAPTTFRQDRTARPTYWAAVDSNDLNGASSVKKFGAVGDGIADDTTAFENALSARQSVFVPAGVYRLTRTLKLRYGQTLYGEGEGSVLQARSYGFDPVNYPVYQTSYDCLQLIDGYITVHSLRIVGGATAVKLGGSDLDGPVVKCVVENMTLYDPYIGITLDGGNDTNKPVYWNSFNKIAIMRMGVAGVLLTTDGAGDSPNANKFNDVRAYSNGAPMEGSLKSGFYISTGRYNNSFVDCEANMHPDANSCMFLGSGASQCRIVNFYAESLGPVPGISLNTSADDNTIINLFSATGGAPIYDPTLQRKYQALFAGDTFKNDLKKTRITDAYIELLTLQSKYYSAGTTPLTLDATVSQHLVSAFDNDITVALPDATANFGKQLFIMKRDNSENKVFITETGGVGPEGRIIALGNDFDAVQLTSDGAQWVLTATKTKYERVKFVENQATYNAPGTHDIYLVAASTTNTAFHLPVATTTAVIGHRILIKRSDVAFAYKVTVDVTGGDDPDLREIVLANLYDYVEVMSNGLAWYILSTNVNIDNGRTYVDAGTINPSVWVRTHYCDTTAGAQTMTLPTAAAGAGRVVTFKKTNSGTAAVTINVASSGTIDGQASFALRAQFDYVTLVSEGTQWYVIGTNIMPFTSQYVSATGATVASADVELYVMDATSGAQSLALPAANGAGVAGKRVAVKKIDNSAHIVTVTQVGGGGPDGSSLELNLQNESVEVFSDGNVWRAININRKTPVATWSNPSGSGFNRGSFDADAETSVSFTYVRDEVNDINQRVKGHGAVLRALILDLKTAGIIS